MAWAVLILTAIYLSGILPFDLPVRVRTQTGTRKDEDEPKREEYASSDPVSSHDRHSSWELFFVGEWGLYGNPHISITAGPLLDDAPILTVPPALDRCAHL
jgi:hypothetical protein